MLKLLVTLFVVAVCLMGFSTVPAQAASISSCVIAGVDPTNGFDLQTCTIDEADGEFIQISNVFPAPDWFDSWVILTEPANPGGASDVLHFDPVGTLTFWSDGAAGFLAALASALAANDVLRVAENPTSGAATTFFTNYQSSFNPAGAFSGCGLTTNGSCDTIRVFSNDGPGGGQVPEPATLTLVGLGSAAAAFRRRRNVVKVV